MTAESVNAPHNPRTIYIQTIFDTETILANYAKSTAADKPTMLNTDSKTVMYMLVNWADHIYGQATGNLEIQAEVGDYVQWRTMSLSNNTGEAAVFYQFVLPSQTVLRMPLPVEGEVTVPVPVLSTDNPPVYKPPYDYKMMPMTDTYWYTVVDKVGSSLYRVCFFILTQDPATRKLVRYFYTWDPRITIIKT